MIATLKTGATSADPIAQAHFLAMLPKIREVAQFAFRRAGPSVRS